MPIERLAQVPWQALDVAAALPVIDSVLAGAPADRELERLLRGHREWASPQRTAAAEAVFGVGLWRRRLGWHAGVEAGDLLIQGGPRPRPNAIVSRASDIAGALLASLLRDLAGAPLPRSLPHSPPARAGDPGRLADRWSLPDWLERHLQRELGAPADRFCAAISEPGPITLRANRALSTRDQLAARLRAEDGIETIPARRAPDALHVRTPQPNLLGCRASREGTFEVQDEGSQLVGLLAAPRCGGTVLDLCAGAGGKSLLLAAAGAHVFAFDTDPERLLRLRARARRARAETSIEVVASPRPADCVLVDAPCSELGALRRGPDARWRIDPASLNDLPRLQRELLETAAPLARRRLVYATCTLSSAENELVATAFERGRSDLRRTTTFSTSPHEDGTDGFFAVVWERS